MIDDHKRSIWNTENCQHSMVITKSETCRGKGDYLTPELKLLTKFVSFKFLTFTVFLFSVGETNAFMVLYAATATHYFFNACANSNITVMACANAHKLKLGRRTEICDFGYCPSVLYVLHQYHLFYTWLYIAFF